MDGNGELKLMKFMRWHHEPPAWKFEGDKINVFTGAKSDFWRETHYGFIRDNGHFYFQEIAGDFVVGVKIIGQYESLYDQAGLMVRVDKNNWIKCGIEFVNGVQQASVVVTRDFSDWSIVPLPENPASIWLRVKRQKETIEIYYSLDGENYAMLRLAYLTLNETVQAGLMCASPDGDGFTVTFKDFEVNSLEAENLNKSLLENKHL
jgi:uncharacterized protein